MTNEPTHNNGDGRTVTPGHADEEKLLLAYYDPFEETNVRLVKEPPADGTRSTADVVRYEKVIREDNWELADIDHAESVLTPIGEASEQEQIDRFPKPRLTKQAREEARKKAAESFTDEVSVEINPDDIIIDEPDLDQLIDILSARRRRAVLRMLDAADMPITLDYLATRIACEEQDCDVTRLTSQERKRVYVSLYQCHLGKMDEAGIIDYNKDRGVISPTPLSETAVNTLRSIESVVTGREGSNGAQEIIDSNLNGSETSRNSDDPTAPSNRFSEALKQTRLGLEELETGSDAHEAGVEALQCLEVAQELVQDNGGDA